MNADVSIDLSEHNFHAPLRDVVNHSLRAPRKKRWSKSDSKNGDFLIISSGCVECSNFPGPIEALVPVDAPPLTAGGRFAKLASEHGKVHLSMNLPKEVARGTVAVL